MRRTPLVLLGAVLACGGSSTSPASSPFTGTWNAVSVGSVSLPAIVSTSALGYTEARARSLIVSVGLAFWEDSTVRVVASGALAGTTNAGGHGQYTVTVTAAGSVLHAVERSPCLCTGSMPFTVDFTLRTDGMLEARVDASDGPVTVFRRQ